MNTSRLILVLALTGLFQAPARAELILDSASTDYWRGLQVPYRQDSGDRPWYSRHGVAITRCDTAALGSRVGSRRDATIGVHLGRSTDTEMDAVDRACLGHALESAPERRSVRWRNYRSGAEYDIVPLRRENHNGLQCRFFEGSSLRDGQRLALRGKACRAADGIWRVA